MIPHGHKILLSLALPWLQPSPVSTTATASTSEVCSNDSSGETSCSTAEKPSITSQECGIWLAPSSLEGAGLGMYAGKDYQEGEMIGPSGDVVIATVDIESHQFAYGPDYYLLWDEYFWNGGILGMQHEGHIDVKVASPGFGSAANCFIDLINVEEGVPAHSIPHRLHRSKDPGTGAFSTHHNRTSTAQVDIKQGQEFFVDYGEQWFIDRPQLGPIPVFGSLDAATDLFRRFKQIHERYPALKQQILDELWETFVVNTEFENSRTIGSFHKTEKEWQMLEANMTLKEIRVQDSIRSLEWLQEHGTCGDNLRQDLSTIEQAGNGAFATRNLAKDSIVAQMPLIHISNSSIFDMYHFTDLRSLQTEHKIMQRQLQVNYCLWHTTSTLLLCPYGPGTSLINHNQTLANVKLQWGDPKRGNHEPQLLERPIEHFAKDSTAKLAMELIATRDIEEGEEVFLDYGDEWEAAWQTHVCLWKPIQNADRYISAYQMNEDERLLTVFEQLHYPYPSNVNLYCDVNFFSRIDWVALENEGKVIFTTSNEKFLPCEVLRYREIKSSLRYTAVVTRSATDGEPERFEKLTDAPREAFLFRDRPYSSDMFQPNAFRHPMMIPDEMFPEMWMNLPSLD